MIEKVSIKLSKEWGRILKVDDEDVECYRYGLELLLSTICNIVIMVIISVLFQRPLLFLPYTFVYVPMRMFAGGYHASNHLRCIQFSSVSFLLCTILCRFVQFDGMKYICFGIIFLSAIVFKKTVPVEAKNKPLNDKQRKRAKRCVVIIEAVLLVLWFFLYFLQLFSEHFLMIYYAEFAVLIATALGYVKNS